MHSWQTDFRNQLAQLSSWQARARKIDAKLAVTDNALGLRNEKLLALRADFDALTIAFWAAFAKSLV
jgi:hypothetical protein